MPDDIQAKDFVTHFSKALKSASEVALQARTQLAGYKSKVAEAEKAINDARKAAPQPTDAEKELMATSALAVSSLADVFITFADAAVDQLSAQSNDTRQKAMTLVRKVLKLAVDDALGDAFSDPPRTIGPIPRSVEVQGDASAQHVYLPTRKPKSNVNVKLERELPGLQIHVKKEWKALAPGRKVPLELTGSNPRISLRIDRNHKVRRQEVAFVHLSGDIEHTIAVIVTPSGAPAR